MIYPSWICHDCGVEHGNGRKDGVSCWHQGKCEICKRDTSVTEPRDYGHLKENSQWNTKTLCTPKLRSGN